MLMCVTPRSQLRLWLWEASSCGVAPPEQCMARKTALQFKIIRTEANISKSRLKQLRNAYSSLCLAVVRWLGMFLRIKH